MNLKKYTAALLISSCLLTGKKKFLTNIIDIKIPGYALLICSGTVFLPLGKSNSTYPGYIHTPAKMLVSVSIIFYF